MLHRNGPPAGRLRAAQSTRGRDPPRAEAADAERGAATPRSGCPDLHYHGSAGMTMVPVDAELGQEL